MKQWYLVQEFQVYDRFPEETDNVFITQNPDKYRNYKYPKKDSFVISYKIKKIKTDE